MQELEQFPTIPIKSGITTPGKQKEKYWSFINIQSSVCTRSVKLKLSKYRAKYVANGFEIQSNYRAKANNFPKNTILRKM